MVNLAMTYLLNERLVGDYVEFGVYRGDTFVEAYRAANLRELDHMRFIACDSFEGLPAADGPFQAGEFASPRSAFEANLRRHRIPPERVEIIEGFFADSLPGALPDQIAVAWVDCDIYESARPVLSALTDRLIDGAVLCFDDWFTHRGKPDDGEQRACREWLESTDFSLTPYRDFHWAGRAFLVDRRASRSSPSGQSAAA